MLPLKIPMAHVNRIFSASISYDIWLTLIEHLHDTHYQPQQLIYNNKHKAHELSFCLSMQTTVRIFIIPGKAVILIIFYNFIFIITVLKLYSHLVHNSKVTKGFLLLASAFHTPSKSFRKLPSFIEFIRWSSRDTQLI